MYSANQRDLFYETVKSLSFNDLRHLCQSNRENRSLCNDERVQQLIQKRHKEMIIKNKINSAIDQFNAHTKNRGAVIIFRLDGNGRDHELMVDRFDSKITVTETFNTANYTNSILYKYATHIINSNILPIEQLLDKVSKTLYENRENLDDFITPYFCSRNATQHIDDYVIFF